MLRRWRQPACCSAVCSSARRRIVFHPADVAKAGDTPLAAASAGVPSTVLPSAAAPSIVAPGRSPGVPPAALAALRQSAILNQRIADRCRPTGGSPGSVSAPSSNDIARALRALSGDASFGARIVPDVARWDDAAVCPAQLDTFYAAITATAKDGLAVSLQSTTSYVQAGRAMAKVARRSSAPSTRRPASWRTTAGTDLPPVTLPTAP